MEQTEKNVLSVFYPTAVNTCRKTQVHNRKKQKSIFMFITAVKVMVFIIIALFVNILPYLFLCPRLTRYTLVYGPKPSRNTSISRHAKLFARGVSDCSRRCQPCNRNEYFAVCFLMRISGGYIPLRSQLHLFRIFSTSSLMAQSGLKSSSSSAANDVPITITE